MTDEHGATTVKYKTVDVVPQWRKEIRIGDILFDPTSLGGVGHVGIYYGLDMTVEARLPVVTSRNIDTWDSPNRKGAYLICVRCSDEIAKTAADLAWQQIGKVYDPTYYQKNSNLSQDHWYCSELVWAVYKNAANIDLEYTPDNFAVSPLEIYLEASLGINSYIISHHGEYAVIPDFDSDTVGIPESWFLNDLFTVLALCPVDVQVTDPNGLIVNRTSIQIPGAIYMLDDLNEDGSPDIWIVIPSSKLGKYLITLTPEAQALPTDTYSLKVLENGHSTVLARNTQIANIPNNGYVFRYGA